MNEPFKLTELLYNNTISFSTNNHETHNNNLPSITSRYRLHLCPDDERSHPPQPMQKVRIIGCLQRQRIVYGRRLRFRKYKTRRAMQRKSMGIE